MIEYNAAKRPSGLRACADGLDSNPDKDFAQKCMRYAADKMEELEQQRDEAVNNYETAVLREHRMQEQRDRLAEALREIADCDFVITLPDRMDAVRAIAREALGDIKWHKL